MNELTINQKYEARIKQWCKATGLQTSKVGAHKVLPWFDKYSYPTEFDHQRIFYYSLAKLYVLIAEPYPSGTTSAAKKAVQMANGRPFAMVECGLTTGLWNPGVCEFTMIARADAGELLEQFVLDGIMG